MKLPLIASFALIAISSIASAQVTQRVSVALTGGQPNIESFNDSISDDGRYVAFASRATNLVSGDTNGWMDIFVRDRLAGTTTRLSLSTGGAQANNESYVPAISADGRYIGFESDATNLVFGDLNATLDVFVRDRIGGMTERMSVSSAGVEGNFVSLTPSLSADGRYVAFTSFADNLVVGDTNGMPDVFVRDRIALTTERVSIDSGGVEGDFGSVTPSISADGRYVTFDSFATNLVGGDSNGVADIFVRDRLASTTTRVSVDSTGNQGNLASRFSSISSDGRYVAFASLATNLVAGDTNGFQDVFVRDRQLGTTERESMDTTGAQGNGESKQPSISGDGRFVAFDSDASNLVGSDTNGVTDILVRDRLMSITERANLGPGNSQGNLESHEASLSFDGRYASFWSHASNLIPNDLNGNADVFVRDRLGAPNFSSLCDPGLGGVIACPCANPPSGPGRGCNNSAGTGGAILTASGGTYLSSDSLVFVSSSEKPTALSLLAQWIAGNPTGAVFGMGVRCTSGTFKRLFSRNAVGGIVTLPNFGLGDLTVSAQSAAKGDTILAGQSRWYFVYYRDNTVLGGCPPTSNFNATQTGQVTWSP